MNNISLYEGQFVHLTSLDPEKDSEAISAWTASPEFVRRNFDGIFKPYRVDELKKKLKEKLKKADERKDEFYFAIRENGSEKLVGLLRFGWMMPTHQIARLFLDIGTREDFEKYSEDVLRLSLRYAFMEISLHRLFVCIPSNEEKEITLYEKAGFLRESQRRQNIYHAGQYHDELVYALLRPEWKALRKELN